ncbi:MAG: DUF1566 domain-containing protein [Candidatus Electrothrix sp. GM3_4]|nr:DUF1566 domain-containing protein [Candidatus Electrothrix sp. GM3_4]
MKKRFLLFTLIILFLSSSSVVLGEMRGWLLYLPAILSGTPQAPPDPTTPGNPWLLFLPPILAAAQSTPPPVTDPVLGMNDTGIVACVGDTTKEDCNYGRDATELNSADGYAGFSFTKLDNNGVALVDQNAAWSCVKDNTTGLVWEVKTAENSSTTYSWYNSDTATNGGSFGNENDGEHNTEAYVATVNTAGLCGAKDWRMPTVKELVSLVSLQATGDTIDTDYFPNNSGIFWTGTPADRLGDETAWGVSFSAGNADRLLYKNATYRVRLVRTNSN